MKHFDFISHSLIETHTFGEKLGQHLFSGAVILLDGDLGAGKTALTQGIAKGLGVKGHVTSPTFTIERIYKGNIELHHLDAYRLEGLHQDLGFDELLYDDCVTVIEWSTFVPDLVPENYLKISVSIDEQDNRHFAIDAYGDHLEKILEEIL